MSKPSNRVLYTANDAGHNTVTESRIKIFKNILGSLDFNIQTPVTGDLVQH